MVTIQGIVASRIDLRLLEANQPISREMKAGDEHSYEIVVSADQLMEVVAEQQGVNLSIALVGPAGERLLEADSGKCTDQAAITMDWTATILGVTDTAADPSFPLDGENLMPVCSGQRAPYERSLFWRIRGYDAARIGSWKYLRDRSGAEHLFDLANDPGEKADTSTMLPLSTLYGSDRTAPSSGR